MKRKKVIILNGWTKGDISHILEFLPDNPANWMGWTKKELEQQGYEVYTPFLKDAYKQEYEEWKEQIESMVDIDEHSTLVGWSSGGAFWVRWLAETKASIDTLILVAPAKCYVKNGKEESNFDRFMDFTIDSDIQTRVHKIVVFISNDTEDLLQSAALYTERLNAQRIEIPNQGHFTNAERLSPEFPELLDEIIGNK